MIDTCVFIIGDVVSFKMLLDERGEKLLDGDKFISGMDFNGEKRLTGENTVSAYIDNKISSNI